MSKNLSTSDHWSFDLRKRVLALEMTNKMFEEDLGKAVLVGSFARKLLSVNESPIKDVDVMTCGRAESAGIIDSFAPMDDILPSQSVWCNKYVCPLPFYPRDKDAFRALPVGLSIGSWAWYKELYATDRGIRTMMRGEVLSPEYIESVRGFSSAKISEQDWKDIIEPYRRVGVKYVPEPFQIMGWSASYVQEMRPALERKRRMIEDDQLDHFFRS